MPGDNNSDISYRVKCVVVESERVFGDIVVTQQTRDRLYWINESHYSKLSRRKICNLTKQILEIPDFMALNRKPKNRELSAEVMTILPIKNGSKFARKNAPVDNGKIIANTERHVELERKQKSYPLPMLRESVSQEVVVTSLVDQLLLDIYGYPRSERGRSESDSTVSSYKPAPQHRYLQRARLLRKSNEELSVVLITLEEHVNHAGGLLIRQLRRRDYLTAKRDKQYDVITAHLQAYSAKRSEDTRMRFSLTPQPGESGFTQWLDAMKMVARLQGGIPQEFRKRLWLTLAERHLDQRGVDWKQAEKLCFNEWSNPDDEELGIQIVKDLHRTGCSLFCGAAGRDNQAVLRRVLLGFARWNKSVGYCQGLNVLAALVLQVTDRAESSAVKVMIYLIEGVLPEGYFADNLRGLSIDMAVFRDLLRMRLPKLSRHLEALQNDAKDKATGSSYEPPLTNVFTMQWFLTLFCHCLPQEAVLRVWDLIFLEGDEVLLRTALAIWEGISDRIMTVTSADEFYSIMGVLTREMLEFTDVNNLIKTIVNMGPLYGVTDLREKHRYNITPWARRLSDEEDTDTEDEERLAVAAAMFGVPQRFKKDRSNASSSALQTIGPTSDRERLALDISTLKHQYAKLRERQRQAHIILSAACARQSMVPSSTSQAMNHLLVGKSALVSAKTRQLGPPPGAIPPKPRTTSTLHTTRVQAGRRDKQGVTLHWKDTKKPKDEPVVVDEPEASPMVVDTPDVMSVTMTSSKRASSNDSDSDSTSTELCDEPDRLSDVDSEEPTSTSDCYVMATDDEKSPRPGASPIIGNTPVRQSSEQNSTGKRDALDVQGSKLDAKRNSRQLLDVNETSSSIAKITDQIRRLSASDENNLSSISPNDSTIEKRNEAEADVDRESDKTVSKNETFSEIGINVEEHFSVSSVTPETDEITRTNSHVFEETFEMVDRYVFLSSSDKPGIVEKRMESRVPSVDKYCEIGRDELSIAGTNNSALSVDATSDLEMIKTTAIAESTPLESTSRKVVSEDILRFEANAMIAESYENDGSVTTDQRVSDSSEDRRVSCGTLICPVVEHSETIADEQTFYSRSYVIGHLPISPATVNEKLSRAAELSPMTDNIRILSKDVGNFDTGVEKNIDTNFGSVMKIGTENESVNSSSVVRSTLPTSTDHKMPIYEVHKSVETNSSSSVAMEKEERIPDSLTLFDKVQKTNDSIGYSDYSVGKNINSSLVPDSNCKIVSPDHNDISPIGNARIPIDRVSRLDYDVRNEKTGSLDSDPKIVSPDRSNISSIGNARILFDQVGSLDYDVREDKTESLVSDPKIVSPDRPNISSIGNTRILFDPVGSLGYDVREDKIESLVSDPKIVSPDRPNISSIGNTRILFDPVGSLGYDVREDKIESLVSDPKIVSPDRPNISSIGNTRILFDPVGSLGYDVREDKTESLVSDPKIVSPDRPNISSIGNRRILFDPVGSLDYDVREDKTESLSSDSKIVSSIHSDVPLARNERNLIEEAKSLTYDVREDKNGSLISDPKVVSLVHSDISFIGNPRNPIDKVRSLDYDVQKDKTESFVSDPRIVGPVHAGISLIGNARNPIDKAGSLDHGVGQGKTGSFASGTKIVGPVHSDISLINNTRDPDDKAGSFDYIPNKDKTGSLINEPKNEPNTRNLTEIVDSLQYDLVTNNDTSSTGPSILPLNKRKMSSSNEEKPATSLSLSITNTSSSKLSSSYAYTDSLLTKIYEDKKKSPKTPDSGKSFSSGETMGPDSKNSSLTTSPRSLTNRSDSRNFPPDKSERSSLSSDSKTLTLRSLESESGAVNDKMKLDAKSNAMRPSLDKSSPSTPISTDSLKNKTEISPKFVISSSSESCSPGKATKSSERSFSSDLQSPISANSIKYRTSYTEGQDNLSESPMDICSATSPFYPIVNPNQKTPSPYGTIGKQRANGESVETSPEQKSTSSKDDINSSKYNVDAGSLGVTRSNEVGKSLRDNDEYDSARPFEKELAETLSTLPYERPKTETIKSLYKEDLDLASYRSKKTTIKEEVTMEVEERYMETDTVSPLPSDKYEANRSAFLEKSSSFKGLATKERDHKYLLSARESFKPFERSCSSLEKSFTDLKTSPSSEELSINTHKKRSSDILEDLKHLEAKTSKDGKADTSMLTRKTGYVWEDLKNLEARRQDNFSDSASEFTRERFDPPQINVLSECRKSYVVEPKINIETGSDSILKSYSRKKSNGEPDDDRESKLGVWTKVKPRAGRDNGRRSSDRALKIIQENSAILHKILTCQAKKRLPDLEEISKEITISPINEEISKIFSPILEKMGLNEHEINEELARINFKDFDQMTTTSGSEFDAKMNDELSKLSLIDDNEIVDHMDIDDVISRNYLDTREALIDRQINEELSKLLANYDEASPICTAGNREEASSSCQNQSEIEALDISSISTNVFSYQSSNESIEMKSELDSIQDATIHAGETFSQYTDDAMMKFVKSPKYSLRGMSPRSDIDIYRELEKLDKISSGEILPSSSSVISQKIVSPMSYGPECPIYTEIRPSSLEYCVKPDKSFERSPMKSPYDTYRPYDFKSRISPRKTPSNPYSARSYEKAGMEKSFDFHENLTTPSSLYDVGTSRPILSKETLEFRVRYDDETSKTIRNDDLSLEPYQTSLVDLDRGASYYSNESSLSLKRLETERILDQTIVSPLDCTYNQIDLYSRKYDSLSPKNYSYEKSMTDYDKHESHQLDENVLEAGSYLSLRRKNSHSLSPNYQYDDREFGSSVNPYSSELSTNLEEASKRPISHPEFSETISQVVNYQESTSREAMNFRKASLSLGPLDMTNSRISGGADTTQSPRSMFSPFPIRNLSRKPKELGLKLGLYSPSSPGSTPLKRS